MNWDAIGATGELLGSLVVIATILYLAKQVQISNKAQRVQAFERVIGMSIEFRRDVTNNPELANILVKAIADEELNETEMLQLRLHSGKWPEILHVGFQHWKAGSIEQHEWDSLCGPTKARIKKHLTGDGNIQDQVIYESLQFMPKDMQDHFGLTEE